MAAGRGSSVPVTQAAGVMDDSWMDGCFNIKSIVMAIRKKFVCNKPSHFIMGFIHLYRLHSHSFVFPIPPVPWAASKLAVAAQLPGGWTVYSFLSPFLLKHFQIVLWGQIVQCSALFSVVSFQRSCDLKKDMLGISSYKREGKKKQQNKTNEVSAPQCTIICNMQTLISPAWN